METSVLNPQPKTKTSLEDLKKLGFYETPQKFLKKNLEKMGLMNRNFEKLQGKNKFSFVYVSLVSEITLVLLTDLHLAYVDVISDNNTIIYEERFYNLNTIDLINNLYKSLSSLKEVIDDELICSYENCRQIPRIKKNKNGLYYWLCPANHTHKKNQVLKNT